MQNHKNKLHQIQNLDQQENNNCLLLRLLRLLFVHQQVATNDYFRKFELELTAHTVLKPNKKFVNRNI